MIRGLGPLALATAIAACGSNSPTRFGQAAHQTQAQMHLEELRFVRCVRSHGIAGLPDPTSPREFKLSLGPDAGALAHSPAFRSATMACQHLLPSGPGGTQGTPQQTSIRRADGLSFARCMRSHHVDRFPDPNAQGELTVAMVQAQGINLHDPGTLRAVNECLPASHGALTAAKIRAALNRASG